MRGTSLARVQPQETVLPEAVRLGEKAVAAIWWRYQQNPERYQRYGRWFALSLLAALIDGKLLLAIATGAAAYRAAITSGQPSHQSLQRLSQQARSHLAQPQLRPYWLSGLTFAGTYLVSAVWVELHSPWLAIACLGMGAANVALLGWVIRSESAPSPASEHRLRGTSESVDGCWWQQLTDPDALKRLMAVRHLTRWLLSSETAEQVYLPGSGLTVRSHLVDCFHLMLTQEPEPLVRTALRESLRLLQPPPKSSAPQLGQGPPPIPSMMQRPRAVAHRPCVEYVEP